MGGATHFCEAAGFDVEHDSDDFAFVHVNDQSVFDLDRIDGLDPATTPGVTSSPTRWTTGTPGSSPLGWRSHQSRTSASPDAYRTLAHQVSE